MIWLTKGRAIRTMRALMSNGFPDSVDAWRMVNAARSFEGSLAVADLPRLCASLAAVRGRLSCQLAFGRDEMTVAFLHLQVQGLLPLTCQRTLEVFDWQLKVDTRLGLITREEDEAGLPAGYEPLLLPADGELKLADVIEDEVILALPVVPRKPEFDTEDEWVWTSDAQASRPEPRQPNPFAALASLKQDRK